MIHVGYAVGTGATVAIPLAHLAVTGQTQSSGKTTTLEALVARSARPAIAFVTKRGEGSFSVGRRVQPYFRDRADWVFVDRLLEAALQEKNKYLRQWLIPICRTTKTLGEVHQRVRQAMEKATGKTLGAYVQLDAYLELIVPEIARAQLADRLDVVGPGLNVMDVSAYARPMQMLFVQSAIDWVNEREHGVTVIVPEAWEFIPQGKGSPVKASAETLVRKGAGIGNLMWTDSQDMAGVDNIVLRGSTVWLIGVQREANEIKRALANIPAGVAKPKAADVALLELGQFFVCYGRTCVRTYVQPAWMSADAARAIATGKASVPAVRPRTFFLNEQHQIPATPVKEDPSMCQEHQRLAVRVGELEKMVASRDSLIAEGKKIVEQQTQQLDGVLTLRNALRMLGVGNGGSAGVAPEIDIDDLAARVAARMPAGGQVVQVMPLEQLQRDFLVAAQDRLVAKVDALAPLEKASLKALIALGRRVPKAEVARALGRATAGESMQNLSKAIDAVCALGLADNDIKTRHGVAAIVREGIAAELATWTTSPEDIDAVYQRIVYAIATPGAAAA